MKGEESKLRIGGGGGEKNRKSRKNIHPRRFELDPSGRGEGSNSVNSDRICKIRNSAESYCLADSDGWKRGSRYRVVF